MTGILSDLPPLSAKSEGSKRAMSRESEKEGASRPSTTRRPLEQARPDANAGGVNDKVLSLEAAGKVNVFQGFLCRGQAERAVLQTEGPLCEGKPRHRVVEVLKP